MKVTNPYNKYRVDGICHNDSQSESPRATYEDDPTFLSSADTAHSYQSGPVNRHNTVQFTIINNNNYDCYESWQNITQRHI